MRLYNLLIMPGGIPEQGRDVTFRLRYKGPGGIPQVRDVTGHMLPLSEVEMEQAQKAAQNPEGRVLQEGQEYVLRLLQASLRDPADLSKLLIEDPRDLQFLRDGLVAPQYGVLLDEYKQLLAQEYPATVMDKDVDEMEREAQDFSRGGQPGPG